MTIWALKAPNQDHDGPGSLGKDLEFLSSEMKNGNCRFGWSYIETADLRRLNELSNEECSEHELYCWAKSNFLLQVEKGDWIVYINLPHWGMCTIGQVVETYSFSNEGNYRGEFRHLLKLDTNSIIEFDRNDARVLPIISSRLKLQRSHWRIYYQDEFFKTIDNLKNANFNKPENETAGIFHLKNDILPLIIQINAKIQSNHPGSKLEGFIASVLRNIPNVTKVIEYGTAKGWGSDYGADLIVNYEAGLPIDNLQKEGTLVVQVKSFVGDHWDTNAVAQIESAIEKFKADAGLIITTAESTQSLQEEIDKLSTKLSKPIALIAGSDVAKFVLKYGGDIIL